jgi:His-Xaa-Ser system radical SAM maturase HxsC
MLPLYGRATATRGFGPTEGRQVFRLCAATAGPEFDADIALIRSEVDLATAASSGFSKAFVTGELPNTAIPFDAVVQVGGKFEYLDDGDIVGFQPSTGHFRTHYRRKSAHNSFLVTERCNHYCLMCSQPPRDVDDSWILQEIRAALPLVHKQTPYLGFTGGEPLLNWIAMIETLRDCRDFLPQTAIHVLSNGRAFAESEVSTAWAAVAHPSLTVGIPIYSAVDSVHDYVVQAPGAFDETVLGILKLKDQGQRVEVRVVLHSITVPRIAATARWLARNLHFVDHVALMGLENTGFAIANDELLWIDPIDYREDLAQAVDTLVASKVSVSVYNLPKCVLDVSVWPYARQSISDWKNEFVPACSQCLEKPSCSGFFATGRPRYSRGINPILA